MGARRSSVMIRDGTTEERSANITTDHEFAVVASTTDLQKVFVAIELSKSTWVVGDTSTGSRQSESVSDCRR